MPDNGNAQPERPWQEIARELSQEHDSDKVFVLSMELNRALEKQVQKENSAMP
jgi:hypothetical protein